MRIFVDADACPVKQEVYRVARRCNLPVVLVSNSPMRIPPDELISMKIVGGGLDAADDWIADNAGAADVVVTADIPLADRCVKNSARVISPVGKIFTEKNIGQAVATRDLLTELRGAGEMTGGPPPMTKRDRSNFLQALDEVIRSLQAN